MRALLAVGVPGWPAPGHTYDWWPVAVPALAFAAALWPFRIPMSPRSVIAIAIGGFVVGSSVGVIGIPVGLGIGVLALGIAAMRSRRPRNLS